MSLNAEPHMVNTWNSFMVITDDERILIAAYGFRKTEKNVHINSQIKLSIGSKNVLGYKAYLGTGFIVTRVARYINSGAEYDMMKEKFDF